MTARFESRTVTAAVTRRHGLLRYEADWLTVLWIQVMLLVSLLPWMLPTPLWARLVLVIPVFFLRSSGAYIQHNHGHLGIFWSRTLNFLLDIELALMTGYVTPLWELQHARGHHRHYLTPENDPASIIDRRTGEPMARWRYCLVGNLTIIRDSWRIGGEDARRTRSDPRPRLVLEFIVAGALAALLCYLNWASFVEFIFIPNVVVSWAVWHVSYDHHYDVRGTTHYDGSNNHLGREFNWSRFNLGHHAAHHEKPTLHWSLLPQRSAQILPITTRLS